METLTIKMEAAPQRLQYDVERNDFALALKTWRLRHDYTQKQVAHRWGVSRYTIMRAEAANPISWEMAYKLFNRLAYETRNDANVQQ